MWPLVIFTNDPSLNDPFKWGGRNGSLDGEAEGRENKGNGNGKPSQEVCLKGQEKKKKRWP